MYAATVGPNMKWGQGTTGPPLATVLFSLYDYGFTSLCNLGLFEITEWEPRMLLLKTLTDIFAGIAARQ